MIARSLLLIGFLLPLTGCVTVGPDYEAPEQYGDVQWSAVPAGTDETAEADEAW